MKIWLLEADSDKYNSFDGYEVEENLDISFFGHSIANQWIEPSIKAYYKKKKIADVSGFSSGAPLFNEKAVKALQEFLNGNVELLLANYEDTKYYVVNVVNIIDALDYEKSKFARFDTGEIMHCVKYFFKHEVVENQHIFKIPLGNSIRIFISDDFKKRVEETGLKGIRFVEAWNSNESAAPDHPEPVTPPSGNVENESEGAELMEDAIPETENVTYPEISEIEAKKLQEKITEGLMDIALQYVKEESSTKGNIDAIGLEYFFDGVYTDIGIRITTATDLDDDEYDEEYYQLLVHPDISYDFNLLYSHYIKDFMNSEETVLFIQVLEEILYDLDERIHNVQWESIADITKDFSITELELYD